MKILNLKAAPSLPLRLIHESLFKCPIFQIPDEIPVLVPAMLVVVPCP
jgi:hypothetical protein